MSEPEPREPSLLKKTRDDVLTALRQLVHDAEKLPPGERVTVLHKAASAVACIDDALTRSRAAFIDAEMAKLRR
jgi:hypothetical protein